MLMFSDICLRKMHHAWQLLILLLGFITCSHALATITDPTTLHEAIIISKKVEKFYGVLLKSQADKRIFAKYALKYSTIEREMRKLVGKLK